MGLARDAPETILCCPDRPAVVRFTFTGLRIDKKARVHGRPDRPIPGLFAAGKPAGGVPGERITGSGSAMARILSLGRIGRAGRGASRTGQSGKSVATGCRLLRSASSKTISRTRISFRAGSYCWRGSQPWATEGRPRQMDSAASTNRAVEDRLISMKCKGIGAGGHFQHDRSQSTAALVQRTC